MRRYIAAAVVLFNALAGSAFAGPIVAEVPDQPDPKAKYLFYLHGRGPQEFGIEKSREDYRALVQAFSGRGFTVVSEVRGRDVRDEDYAARVAQQLGKLLAAGVSSEHVTVVGYSKGGIVALMASGLAARPQVGYVLLAGCHSPAGAMQDAHRAFKAAHAAKLEGRMLSLYDRADPNFASCAPYFKEAAGTLRHQEIVLDTGKGHELFQKPTADWLDTVVAWAAGTARSAQ